MASITETRPKIVLVVGEIGESQLDQIKAELAEDGSDVYVRRTTVDVMDSLHGKTVTLLEGFEGVLTDILDISDAQVERDEALWLKLVRAVFFQETGCHAELVSAIVYDEKAHAFFDDPVKAASYETNLIDGSFIFDAATHIAHRDWMESKN